MSISPLDVVLTSCRWPIGDPRTPQFSYCGEKRERGPYCANHYCIAYVAVKPRHRPDKSIPEIIEVQVSA